MGCTAVRTYLEPVYAEDRTFVVVGMSRLCLALRSDFVKADFLVPTGDCEEILLGALVRVEGQVGDAVGGWLLDLDILLQVSNCVGRRCRSGRATKETRHFRWSAVLPAFDNGAEQDFVARTRSGRRDSRQLPRWLSLCLSSGSLPLDAWACRQRPAVKFDAIGLLARVPGPRTLSALELGQVRNVINL